MHIYSPDMGFGDAGPLKEEVILHLQCSERLVAAVAPGKLSSMREVHNAGFLGGAREAWAGIMDYLSSRSDGSLKPLLIRGEAAPM